MIIETNSPDQTGALGYKLAAQAAAGRIYCLTGELGAGKTRFAKGFAKGLGVAEEITSPTFTIINEYKGRLNFYHMDLYRVESTSDFLTVGFEDYFFGGGVCLLEWADNIKGSVPEDAVWIHIHKDLAQGPDYRRIEIVGLEPV